MPAVIRADKPSLQMEEEKQDRGGERMMEWRVWRRMGEKRERECRGEVGCWEVGDMG
jgi:hypothetical protein